MPPKLKGETADQYTDRLTGADKTNRVPYKERRNRQCSIGYHDECSDPKGGQCQCPCHKMEGCEACEGRGFITPHKCPSCECDDAKDCEECGGYGLVDRCGNCGMVGPHGDCT
jgi:hypothetical protein